MNAKKLATILDKMSIILKNYENEDVEVALDDIIKLLNAQKKETIEIKKDIEYDSENNNDIKFFVSKLEGANSEQIMLLLEDKPKKFLLEIAKTLSLTSSTRQSKATLQHSINKFYERRKIDEIIRNERHDYDN